MSSSPPVITHKLAPMSYSNRGLGGSQLIWPRNNKSKSATATSNTTLRGEVSAEAPGALTPAAAVLSPADLTPTLRSSPLVSPSSSSTSSASLQPD